MKVREIITESTQKLDASKPRNFVAKNAKMGGAGQHKDKKKAMKQGDVKHKNKEIAESQVNELSKGTLSNYSDKADMDIVKKHRVRGPQAHAGDKAAVAKTDKKIDKRMQGIDRANSRLNKGVAEGADERKQNALWAQITQHEKAAKATKNDIKKQHHMKMADQLRSQLTTNEGLAEDPNSIPQDWQEWNVMIMNNFYSGRYPDYSARYYSVVASSPEEAREVVLSNSEKVLKDLLARKTKDGKRVLPPKSALPVEDKRVGGPDRIKPGSVTTMGFKEMLTPNGPMMLKFASGKIVDVQEKQGVAETATAGSTSAGNVAVGAVYKNKKAKMQKPGTNALDMKGGNLLTGGSIKR